MSLPAAGTSCRFAEQGAEVKSAALDGGVLVQGLGVEAAVVGQVGLRGLAAGVEDGVRAHRLEGAALGAAVGGSSRDDDRPGRGPCPGAAADCYLDGGAVVWVGGGDPSVPPRHGGQASASIAHIAYAAGSPS